jgi:hypothetical protein
MRNALLAAGLAVSLLSLLGCTNSETPSVCSQACQYKKALIEAIETADRIVISEQSSGFEEPFRESLRNGIKHVVYRTRELRWLERNRFQRSIDDLSDQDQQAFSLCLPKYHHKIEFYSKAGIQSTMQICFECRQSYWSATDLLPPDDLFNALIPAIERAGFQTKRDWEAVARAAQRNP